MTTTERIEAGAILPGTERPAEHDRDLMSARHYRHPALADRTVVRVVPGSLGVADDLTMSYLGFTEPVRVACVGIGRRQALGFPAWALINDPANAHHALNLVRELERIARQAKSSPGAAKDALMALAGQLGRSAPHFLPTFYEQAGRIYLDAGSTGYAATMFGKAREAEQTYNLTVDPDRQRAVFLEFAFAGALTAKALSAYAKSLRARYGADEAYELFLTLCVERTKGGLPPYSGLPEDLRRLARAAHRQVADEDARVLRALLDSSVITRAGTSFWNAYRASLVALAKADAGVRHRLLSFVPDAVDGHELWLSVLAESGATDALTLPADQAEPTPAGPAGWLSMIARARGGYRYYGLSRLPALLDLVAAMSARLRADGVPVRLHSGWHVELDLLDLCLANGIPLTEPPARLQLDVRHWQRDTTPGARDLTAVAAHPTLRGTLATGLLAVLGNGSSAEQALEPLRAVAGLPLALDDWLAGMADRVSTAGFARIERTLRELVQVAVPLAYVNVPDVARRIAATDLVGALTTALRGGLYDELGWPALDEAVALLGEEAEPGARRQVRLLGQGWPALVLGRGERVVVVGPDGVLLDHVLRIPQDDRRSWGHQPHVTFVDGRLLVQWSGQEQQRAYWSDAPDQVFTPVGADRWYSDDAATASIPLPGGGAFTGGRALHPGDDAVPGEADVLSDGTTYWAWRGASEAGWREVDLATGEVGRRSMPAFLEDFAAEGATLRPAWCELRPVAPATKASPLGQVEGRHGWRVRETADGYLAERIDGERFTVPHGVGRPRAAIRLPGADRSRVVLESGSVVSLLDPDGTEIAALSTDQRRPAMAAGTELIPPVEWWHCLRVRDAAGSVALRSITREQAGALLAAAVAERAGEPPRQRGRVLGLFGRRAESLPDLLATVLPRVTHPGLVEGLLGMFRYAAELQARLSGYADLADRATVLSREPAPRPRVTIPDGVLSKALNWMDRSGRYHWSTSTADAATTLPAFIDHLASAARTRAEGGDVGGTTLPDTASGQWPDVIPALPAVAYRAASALTPDADRSALLAGLDALTDDVFAAEGHWREVFVDAPDPGTNRRWLTNTLNMTRSGFFVLVSHELRNNWRAVQFTARAGEFTMLSGWQVTEARPWTGVVNRAWLDRFRATLAERGPIPWRPEPAGDLVARTGMGHAEAVLLLAGMPHVGKYERNFLPTELRTTLGLKAAEANTARDRLRSLPLWFGYSLLAAAVPADPADLWTTGPDVERLAAAWLTRFERRAPVPDELLVAAAKALSTRDSADLVSGLADPASCTWLNTDARMSFRDDRLLVAHSAGFRGAHFDGCVPALLWLAYTLPVGDPIRAHLADAHDRAAQRADHPEFLVELGTAYGRDELCAVLGLAELPDNQVVEPTDWLTLLVGVHGRCGVYLRPSRLRPEHLPLLDGVAGALGYLADQATLRALAAYRDPAVRAACATRPAEGTDPAAYFQDPTVSAPELVAAATERLGLTPDAAILYLQLLALADPTDANVARWTGWKPARLKAARAELAATDLVLTAKRARAGRSLFLPGGWLALKDAHLPIEEWKKPMFRFGPDGAPVGPLVPAVPLAAHFATAWQRVIDGDTPGYTELRTGARK